MVMDENFQYLLALKALHMYQNKHKDQSLVNRRDPLCLWVNLGQQLSFILVMQSID